jgi:hypothetical protein
MSTLASDFLKSEFKPKSTDSPKLARLRKWTDNYVRVHLLPPNPDASEQLIDQTSERYVFDEDAPSIVRNLIHTKTIDESIVFETIRLPATSVWIEYPTGEGIRVGLLIGLATFASSGPVQHKTVMAVIGQTESGVRAIGLTGLPDFPFKRGESYATCYWWLDKASGELVPNVDTTGIKEFVIDLADCLFLINTPRVSEMRTNTFGHKKPKARHEHEGLPLVEYKRVIVKVGVGTPRYPHNDHVDVNSIESTEARHRRLHRVVGHFRTYREGREQPRVTFVPQHWRGDASLGILLHERVIKQK